MKKKKYISQEEETPVFNEPLATYSTTSPVSDINMNQPKPPCEYSMDELKAGLYEFAEELENDDLIPHENIKRKKI